MAIILGSNLSIRSKHFLDERSELALKKEDLKDWDLVNNPLPNGFEIFLDIENSWYVYDETLSEKDPETGYFKKRFFYVDGNISDINKKIDELEKGIGNIQEDITEIDNKLLEIDKIKEDIINRHLSGVADRFDDLLEESNWIKGGISYVYKGIIVSVINDSNRLNLGTFRLAGDDYKTPSNWIKLLDHSEVIKTGDSTASSNNTVYSSEKTDERFIDRESDQVISKKWKFDSDISFGGNGSSLKIDKSRNDFTTLKVNKIEADEIDLEVGLNNLIKNSAFSGDYRSIDIDRNSVFSERSEVYSAPVKYWLGEGTWTIVEEPESITKKAVKLDEGVSILYQKIDSGLLREGASYTLSFKSTGSITAEIDGNIKKVSNGSYKTDFINFTYSGNNPCIVSFIGSGKIFEPKLEWGSVRSGWSTSYEDTDPVAKDFVDFNFLRGAFRKLNNNLVSLGLRSAIQVGKSRDSGTEVCGGLSGTINSPDDVMFWSGGDFKSAVDTINQYRFDPSFNPENSKVSFILTANGEMYSKYLVLLEKQLKKVLEDLSDSVDQANTTAGEAKDIAEDASKVADQAKSTADQAKGVAEQAKSTAEQAKSTADQAKSTAEQAKSTAEQAKSTADQAKGVAEQAKETANNALSTASKAKEDIARELGYSSYTDMESKDSITVGGTKIRTSLINKDELFSGTIDGGSEKRYTLKNFNAENINLKTGTIGKGWTVRDSGLYTDKKPNISGLTEGRLDVVHDSKNYLQINSFHNLLGNIYPILLKTRLDQPSSYARGIDIDLVSGTGIYINSANKSNNFSNNIESRGSHEFIQGPNDTWNAPGVLWAGHIDAAGNIKVNWGNGCRVTSVRHPGRGHYAVIHDIGSTEYMVFGMVDTSDKWAHMTVYNRRSDSFDLSIHENGGAGLMDAWFHVMIVGRNKG